MWGRGVLLVSFALIALGTTKCPTRKASPVREILCYTSSYDAQLLDGSVCGCTTLVHQSHDVRNLSISDISDLRKTLKEMYPPLQFVISIHDPAMTLRNSAMIRQEAIARIIAVMKEVDGVEMNVTAGSKERLYNFVKSLKNEMIRKSYDKRIFMTLPIRPEDLAKQFDIKELIKYVDLFTLPTDYMTDEDGAFVTFHPSRLMGLFDILNTDSLVDLISGLGAPKQKIVMTLPANAYKFTLKNEDENTPRSGTTEKEPAPIDRIQLCEAINSGEWTVERDEDLTAPYAFQNKTWIAFEDKISVGIKGKYALLRDLAGLAVRNVENDVETECEVPLTQEIYYSFTEFRRKSRQAVLSALEDELHQMQFSYPNHAKTSSFRVVRVVDTEGHIRAVRENTQTEFVCRRQGYFVHPRSCNRFYRCVKFNQEIEDYSVFEFDCPAGLSFDESTEVCVWPGSLPEGSPCPGSSEIAPVTPKRFECSQPGYYADPQNCRWFFACMDLGGEELMAFEFRCPYGLVFDEKKLVCEWPWLVPACSGSGSGYTRTEYNYGGYTAGASSSVGVGGYVNSGLPEYSVTAGMDYSNVDYSTGAGVQGTGYFGSTTGDTDKHPGISISGAGHVGLGQVGTDYSKSTEYRGAVTSVPTYSGSSGIQFGSVPSSTFVVGEGGTGYSTASSKIDDTGYTVSTGQDRYSASTGGFNTGFTHAGGITADFPGSTTREYSGTASGSHLTEQGVTYSGRPPVSSYPSSAPSGYTGSVSTSSPITDTSYSRTSGDYFGSTSGSPGSSIGVHRESTSPRYGGSTNVYSGSSTFNANDYSASTGVYSEATGRQPTFGVTGPSFGSVSYPGASGNIEITGSTATAYGGSSPYSTTGIGRIPGTDFVSGVPKSELETSRISTVSGRVTSRPTSVSSTTGYRYGNEDGYTIPVFVQHEEPSIYPSIGTTRGGTTGPSGIGLTSGYGKTNLNISIFGNEIPTGYDIQRGTTGAIQTGSSVDGSIIIGDSFSGTTFSHGNVPGAVSTSAVNQGTILTGGIRPGYVATSSGTPGYAISDGVKTVEIGSASPGTLLYGTPSPAISISGPSTAGVLLKGDSIPSSAIFGQTAPGVSIGGSIQPGSTIESSTRRYESQSTYHGISGATDSITYSSSTPREGLTPTTPQGYRTDGSSVTFTSPGYSSTAAPGGRITVQSATSGYSYPKPAVQFGTSTVTFNADTSKYTENDIPDYRPTSAILPESFVPGGRIEDTRGGIFGSTFEGSTTPGYSSSKSAVFTPSGFTKTGPTRTGITTAVLGGGGSYSISPSDRRPTYSPDNISEKAFEGNVAGYTKTSFTDGPSVTFTPPGYSSTAASGGRITVQSATSGYSYPKPAVQFGTSTVTFNADTSKYTENDIPDYRPTSAILPESFVPGGRIEDTRGGIFGSTFEGSTTPGYSSSKSAVFTPSGFTKTGPTRTGITTAVLGGGGSYSISPSDRRPTYSPDNISEKAFEGNVAGYTKTSFTDGPSVTFTPPGYSSAAASGGRVTVQSATSGYSYPKPAVQFGTSGATFSSTPIAPTGNDLPVTTSRPFFGRLPTSSVRPVIYTTEQPEIYETTSFESNKIPVAVSSVRPVTEYKTDDRFSQRTGSPASVSTSSIGLGVSFQRTDLNGPTGYSSSLGYLPPKPTEAGVVVSTTKYDESTVTARPEFGVTYKRPSPVPDVTYGGPSSFHTPTTYRPSYYPGQGFSSTPSFLETTLSGGSPTNLGISRDKIDKLITNYDRGTVKYTPNIYDTYSSSGFGSTSTKKFTSSSSFTKSPFFPKTDSGLGFTTPSGIRPSTFSYEVTTKSPEGKDKVIIKWSDLHPLLLSKLGAECTCKADPFANLRGPVRKLIDSSKGKVDLVNYDSSEIYVDFGSAEKDDYSTNYDSFPAQPFKISGPYEETGTISTNLPSSSYLPAADARTPARSNEFHSGRKGKKLEYEDEKEEEEKDEYYEDDPDQIINGVTDCARPGLFRHPALCNKFYACHWDQWKKKFTLHIFNCPVHLTFDSNAGACNWPSKGPACQANNLLV
ncbi:PREDICTED: mucin-17-like [Wasmannia auropunctata]|uniref:mucin-17-like n=1 Tax=Wasmannia auropunctata TaxID=64793 RepID=UPI0005F0020E|nr:PREDICTED: mucin-17-like [Wasmannia auropunctata]